MERHSPKPPCVLTIAGTDPTNAAGLTADLATFRDHACHGLFAATCIIAQNTRGVQHIHPLPHEILAQQLSSIFEDILPKSIKIGLKCSKKSIQSTLNVLEKNPSIPLILDPVLASGTDGTKLLSSPCDLLDLLPHTDLLTPNTQELQALSNTTVHTPDDALRAARSLQMDNPNLCILLKGGHLPDLQGDLFVPPHPQETTHIPWPKRHAFDVRGTGCHLSSAIAANRAHGHDMLQSVLLARSYMDRLWANAHSPLGSGKRLFVHTYP